MAANAPWSVKGIDPKTRETAKEFARRSGLTLGEWLNQRILEEGGMAEAEPPPPAPEVRPAPRAVTAPPASSDLLAGLSQRMEAVEQRSTLAVTGLDQSVRGMLARLESSEQQHTEGRIRVEDRLRKLEDEAAGPRSAQAIRSLEEAFGKVANRVNDTETRLAGNLDDMRREVIALGRRLEELERGHGAGGVLEQRLEQIAATLTARVEAAKAEMASEVEAAGARSTGAVERIGLEVLRMAESLDRRVQSAENRSADAIEQVGGEVARAMSTLERRVMRSDTVQAQALEKLGGEIARITEKLTERIGNAERRSAQAIDDVGEQVSRVTERLNSRYDRASSDLAERIKASEERTARLLEDAKERIELRLADSQRRAGEQIDRIAFSTPAAQPATEAPMGFVDPFEAPPPPVVYADAAPFGVSTFAPPGFTAVEAEFDRADLDAAENFVTPQQAQTEADFIAPPIPAPPVADLVEEPPAPPAWEPDPEELQLVAPQPRQEIAEPEAPAVAEPFAPEPFAPEQVASLSTRQMIEQARAAARAAQTSPKAVRMQDDRRQSSSRGLGSLLGRKRKSSNLKTGLMVSVAFLALTVAVGGYVKWAQTYQGVLPPKVAAGIDHGAAAEYKGPEADTMPRAAMALEPQPIAPEIAAPTQAGAPNAQDLYVEGAQKLEAGDKAGLALIQRAANLGLPAAQGKLGWLYDKGGPGLPINPVEARKWYERAAQGGERLAMHNLALYYFEGTGGPKNIAVAAEWFRRAANAGMTDSQYNLGKLYEQGLGVQQNAAEAYKWYLLAARGGSDQQRAQAKQAAAQVASLVSPEARTAAERSAVEIANQSQAAQTLAARLNAPATATDLTVAQNALIRLGYFKGAADGQMSSALSLAIQTYQRDRRLPATGQLDVGTANSLATYVR